MTDLEFGTYLESMLPGYAEEHVRAGSMPDEELIVNIFFRSTPALHIRG